MDNCNLFGGCLVMLCCHCSADSHCILSSPCLFGAIQNDRKKVGS
jgi:hypothetical protein